MTNLMYTHPRKMGIGAFTCRICRARCGVIRKYGLNVCRRCFRERARDIGFLKLR